MLLTALRIDHLLCEAHERDLLVFAIQIELFGFGCKVIGKLAENMRLDGPSIRSMIFVEQGVHNLDRLIRQFVCLGDA